MREQPIWHSVSLRFLMKFPHPVPYRLLKKASVLSGDSRHMAHEICELGLGRLSFRDIKGAPHPNSTLKVVGSDSGSSTA